MLITVPPLALPAHEWSTGNGLQRVRPIADEAGHRIRALDALKG